MLRRLPPAAGGTAESLSSPRSSNGWWSSDVRALLDSFGVETTTDPVVLWWGLTAAVAMLALSTVGSVSAAVAAVVVLAVPVATRPVVARRRAAAIDAAVPRVAATLARSLSSGIGLEAGLRHCLATEVCSDQCAACVEAIGLGRPALESVGAWVEASAASERVLASTIELALRSGADIARCLDEVADGLRAEAQFRRRKRVVVAQAKASAWVLALLPLGFALASSSFTTAPLVPSRGVAISIGIGLVLDAFGLLWMRRMIAGVG